MALRTILVEFFDDFTQIEPVQTCESAHNSFEEMLNILGWQISDGDKRLPFAKRFTSLGVDIDFSDLQNRVLSVHNKEGRVGAILTEIDKYLVDSKPMGFKEALSLKGKFDFAQGQTFGRVLAPTARVLSKWVGKRGSFRPDDEMILALQHARNHFTCSGPRVLHPQCADAPVLVFTDGACEEVTSVGGVLVDGDVRECFGAVVPQKLIDDWKSSAEQVQVIGQAELFPVLVAKLTWASRLRGRRCIFFLDNESARLALVKAYSPVLASLRIVVDIVMWDYSNRLDSWYARVPTCANISDCVSRMSTKELDSLGRVKIVKPIFPSLQPEEFLK